MSTFQNIVGRTFGRWTVLQRTENRGITLYWLCECACGNKAEVSGSNLRGGQSRSCGCLRSEVSSQVNRTHGRSKKKSVGEKTYAAWCGMRQRCFNQNNARWADYGGRGITVCERWANSFENFLADMGEPPTPLHTVERRNNDKGYEPDNCYWATRLEQSRNRRSLHMVEFNGETMCIAAWASLLEMNRGTLKSRLKRMPTTEAFSKPIEFAGARKWQKQFA